MPSYRLLFVPLLLLTSFTAFADGDLGAGAAAVLRFEDISGLANLQYEHGYNEPLTERLSIAGGVAAADYDGDDLVDLYVVRGTIGANLLFRNLGNGSFEEVGAAAGVDLSGEVGSGPLFADLTGDGLPDLIVGTVKDRALRLYRNLGGGTFADMTVASGLPDYMPSYSTSAGDYDRDGDLDLFVSPWNQTTPGVLWRNRGDGTFDVVGAPDLPFDGHNAFAVNFSDFDADGWPDLLIAGDFGTSKVLRNLGDGTFADVTTGVISDENGMGAAVGDYDNDGDLDWFVSSIWDPDTPDGNWGQSGNRLYLNKGDGTFDDATDAAGVRIGCWGWASCFADFDNDGHLDLFHVNGFQAYERLHVGRKFQFDRSPFFLNQGDDTYLDVGAAHDLIDFGQGRGVVCFDYDRDGDVDIFVANNSQRPNLYRNVGGNSVHWLSVGLSRSEGNRAAIGARVSVRVGTVTQMREIRAGGNFASQDPPEAHFGLAEATLVDELRVRWPDGEIGVLFGVAADQRLLLEYPVVLRDGFESGDLSAWAP